MFFPPFLNFCWITQDVSIFVFYHINLLGSFLLNLLHTLKDFLALLLKVSFLYFSTDTIAVCFSVLFAFSFDFSAQEVIVFGCDCTILLTRLQFSPFIHEFIRVVGNPILLSTVSRMSQY